MVGIIVNIIALKVHHTSPKLFNQSKVRAIAFTSLTFFFSIVSIIIYASSSRADLQLEYLNDQKLNQLNEDQCNRQRRQGNYTIEGGGSWEPEYYLNGNIVYERNISPSCQYEWVKVAQLDSQLVTRYNTNIGVCTDTILFKNKGTDLISFKKNDCSGSPTDDVKTACYVPIDWQKGERKYPYCGCFDNPVPSWMSSSGYCKNVAGFSFGGFLKNLLKP